MPRYFMPELQSCPECGLVWTTEERASLFPVLPTGREPPPHCPRCAAWALGKAMASIERRAIFAIRRCHAAIEQINPLDHREGPTDRMCRGAMLHLSAELAQIAADADRRGALICGVESEPAADPNADTGTEGIENASDR